MEQVKERFLRYVAVDTQSAEDRECVPSTAKQFNLARMLCAELQKMGAEKVRLDEEHAYVYAFLPGNTEEPLPALGLIAHMDTSPALSGENVKPRCIPDYDGQDRPNIPENTKKIALFLTLKCQNFIVSLLG